MSGLELALGVVPLGLSVCQGIVDYYDKCKDFHNDMIKLRRQISNLIRTFRILENELNGLTADGVSRSAVAQVRDCIEECEDGVSELAVIRNKFEKVDPKTFSQRLQAKGIQAIYPFRKSTIVRLEEIVDDLLQQLQLAMEALGISVNRSTQYTVERVEGVTLDTRAGVDRTEAGVKKLLNARNQDQLNDMICWLDAPNPDTNHEAARERHEPGTGKWFLDSHLFKQWLGRANDTASQKTRLLWVYGKPGCCKTILSSTIIEEVRDIHSATSPILYFYFSFSDSDKQSYGGLLRSLLAQLVRQTESAEELESAYKTGKKDVSTLESVLHQMLRRSNTSYIILDALDECPETDFYTGRSQLLEGLCTLLSQSLPIKLLMTSRKEAEIERAVSKILGATCVPIDDEANNVDISLYVENQLRRDGRLQRLPQRTREDIRGTLAAKANGMFRWVYCQLDELRRMKMIRPKYIAQALTTLPKDLPETYERILKDIDCDEVRTALMWIAFSRGTAAWDTIVEACITETDPEPRIDAQSRQTVSQSLRNLLGSLIVVGPRLAGLLCVQFAHFSVKEFLVSDTTRLGPANNFYLNSTAAHASIAQTCVAYLMACYRFETELVNSGAVDKGRVAKSHGLRSDDGAPSGSSGSSEPDHYVSVHFKRYARDSWFHHQRAAESASNVLLGDELHLAMLSDKELFGYSMNRNRSYSERDYLASSSHYSNPTSIYLSGLLGLPETTLWLLQQGDEDVNAACGVYGNALAAASIEDHVSVVKVLLDAGADSNARAINQGAKNCVTVLQLACHFGRGDVAKTLIAHGAEVNPLDVMNEDIDIDTPLHEACSMGLDGTVVRALLDKGARVDVLGLKGPALYAATGTCGIATLDLLYRHGADVNMCQREGVSALRKACSKAETASIRWLLDHGAEVNFLVDAIRDSALVVACSADLDSTIVLALLKKGADVHAKGERGPALHAAARNANIAVLDLLLRWGGDIDARDSSGTTALQEAFIHGRVENAKWLLERGADVNVGA